MCQQILSFINLVTFSKYYYIGKRAPLLSFPEKMIWDMHIHLSENKQHTLNSINSLTVLDEGLYNLQNNVF